MVDKSEATLLCPNSDSSEVKRFLEHYRPSDNRSDIKTGWYWIRTKEGDGMRPRLRDDPDRLAAFQAKGQLLVDRLLADCQVVGESLAHERFIRSVSALAQESNIVSGKWLIFKRAEEIEYIWGKIVKALAQEDGPFKSVGRTLLCAKVATHLRNGYDNYCICVYCEDSWDHKGVASVQKILVEELGIKTSGYKMDAYTILGIYANHDSHINPILYGKHDFMTPSEVEAGLKNHNLSHPSKAKAVKPKTLEEEEAEGGGFARCLSDSDSDDDEPVKKKVKH